MRAREQVHQRPGEEYARDDPGVLLAALSGLCLGGWLGREIYCLHTSQNSLVKDALLAVGTASILAAFIAVRELGWWVWSFAAGDTLVTLFLTTLFAITLFTERTKGVRVYAYARRFVFIRRSDALYLPKEGS